MRRHLVGITFTSLAFSSVIISASAASADAGTSAHAASLPSAAVVCGYNDNINCRAIWRNCGWNTDHIRTVNFIGGESFQCARPGNYDLGPTWFIASSRRIGFC